MKLKNILNEAPKVKVDDGDPFPNMTKWWTYPKEKIMTFVYWTQRQMPPTDEKDYEENWQKVKSQLILRNPPPPNVQLESKLNEAPMDDRFAKEYEKSGNAIRNHIKHELSKKMVYTANQERELQRLDQIIKMAMEVPEQIAKVVNEPGKVRENKSTKLKDLLGGK